MKGGTRRELRDKEREGGRIGGREGRYEGLDQRT